MNTVNSNNDPEVKTTQLFSSDVPGIQTDVFYIDGDIANEAMESLGIEVGKTYLMGKENTSGISFLGIKTSIGKEKMVGTIRKRIIGITSKSLGKIGENPSLNISGVSDLEHISIIAENPDGSVCDIGYIDSLKSSGFFFQEVDVVGRDDDTRKQVLSLTEK